MRLGITPPFHQEYISVKLGRKVGWYRPREQIELTFNISGLDSEYRVRKILLDSDFGQVEIDKEITLTPPEEEFKVPKIELPLNVRFGMHSFEIKLIGKKKREGAWVQYTPRFEDFRLRICPDPDYWIFLSCSYDPKDQKIVKLASHYAHACGMGALQAREFEKPKDTLRKVKLLVKHTDATVIVQTPRYKVNGEITSPWIFSEFGSAYMEDKLKLSLADKRVKLEEQGPLAEFKPTLRFDKEEKETVHQCFSSAFSWLHEEL